MSELEFTAHKDLTQEHLHEPKYHAHTHEVGGIDPITGIAGPPGPKGDKGDDGAPGASGAIGPSGLPGTTIHNELSNLDYISSGHTGFQPSGNYLNIDDSLYSGQAERTVGGITDGDIFVNATISSMWDQLIKQEKFPTLTAPSSTFTSSITGYREIGEIIPTISLASSFSRGSISPQYTAESPYRSGECTQHQYQYNSVDIKTNLDTSLDISGHAVVSGAQTWRGRAHYGAGVQPKSSYGNDYSTPLSAGQTSYISRTITGVYPYFATTVAIETLTQQALASMSSSYVQTDVVAESGGNKQTVELPDAWSTITGIQVYNPISATWEWVGGNKVNSLATFTSTDITKTIQWNIVNYKRYTHNGSLTGSRQLRWYTV